ncbi:MAG TPA: hypothetical protein VMW73_13070 [Spirochaetia bacterium]|nr:hypothetical protein [Spirochaetia bacterium]
MTTESERAREIVLRLLGNPALKDFADLQNEEQIIRFLNANAARPAPAEKSPLVRGRQLPPAPAKLIRTADDSRLSLTGNRFRGFDIKMLHEFHNIASENGW